MTTLESIIENARAEQKEEARQLRTFLAAYMRLPAAVTFWVATTASTALFGLRFTAWNVLPVRAFVVAMAALAVVYLTFVLTDVVCFIPRSLCDGRPLSKTQTPSEVPSFHWSLAATVVLRAGFRPRVWQVAIGDAVEKVRRLERERESEGRPARMDPF